MPQAETLNHRGPRRPPATMTIPAETPHDATYCDSGNQGLSGDGDLQPGMGRRLRGDGLPAHAGESLPDVVAAPGPGHRGWPPVRRPDAPGPGARSVLAARHEHVRAL